MARAARRLINAVDRFPVSHQTSPAARYRHRPGHPLAVQAILAHLRRSGAPEPPSPASAAIG
jgi:hypothetical protein